MVPLGFIPTAIIYMVTSMFSWRPKKYGSPRPILLPQLSWHWLVIFVPRISLYVVRRYIRGFIVGRSNKRFCESNST